MQVVQNLVNFRRHLVRVSRRDRNAFFTISKGRADLVREVEPLLYRLASSRFKLET